MSRIALPVVHVRAVGNGLELLHCGQCENWDAPLTVSGSDATCAACGDVKWISRDIAPHLEPSEVLVVTSEGHLARVDRGDMVHVISATAMTDGVWTWNTAMCGERLGDFAAAVAAGHIVGNYAQPAQVAERVTCTGCRARYNLPPVD